MSDLREESLLKTIARNSSAPTPRVRIGPGDDMAMIDLDGRRLLAAVDQVVEGVHFTEGTDELLIAGKALGRNLSDVAAMAARPVAVLAACALPAKWTQRRAERLFEALRVAAIEWDCPLIGGDTAVHRGDAPLVLSVTILAEPWPEAVDAPSVVTRRAAKSGDGVFVTGRLGGSFGSDGQGRHLHIEPRVHEARELRRGLGARLHSMIDVSDGLGRDSAMLVDDALQVVIDAELIPCHDECDWRQALGDGEDHELCFAAQGVVAESVAGRHDVSTRVTRIGEIRARASAADPACVVRVDGGERDASELGWEHRGAR